MGLLLLDSPLPDLPAPTTSPVADVRGVTLADLALVWDNTVGAADLALNGTDLATDAGLTTAVLLSMFLDRRAHDDDVPPSGDPADRRGWWADQFAAVEGDRIGSRLWLLDRAKATNETALRAKEYTVEALKWLVDDGAATVDVATSLDGPTSARRLLITATIARPAASPLTFRFAHVWDAP